MTLPTKPRKSSAKPPPEPFYFETFAAIDFETADSGRDSACALGIVRCEKGKIVTQYTSLIRPPRRSFQFTWLHGISWEDVADKPSFGELWHEIAPLLDGTEFIAAHNAGFDRGVLEVCGLQEGITIPPRRHLCTVRLARLLWDIRPTKLSDVCGQFEIPLDHHNAASDALACAKIVLKAYTTGVPESAFLKPRKSTS
jgi:DNA polymerase-3 subunit epsilon